MPNARRIKFGTHVVATQIREMEEDTITHEEYQDDVSKALGGKGTATINATQWGDDWTTETHQNMVYWEDYATNWDEALIYPTKYYLFDVTDSAKQLNAGDASGSDCAFLYIKNVDLTNNVLVSLNGTSGNYYIIIPPEGSIAVRGARAGIDDPLDCNDIYVKCASSKTAQIEYLLATE
jgi:hypothetical protein